MNPRLLPTLQTRENLASIGARAILAPLALYLAALGLRLLAAVDVRYPINEGSGYYVAVAGNVIEGRGLVTDALWRLATPPIDVPRAAFDFWQPMASLVAAVPMTVLGPNLMAAQLGHAMMGALAAPLCWAIAREAAARLRLDGRRSTAVSLGSGALAALLGPFVLASAVPDSTTPFLVMGLVCCLLMPRALDDSRSAGLVLGLALGAAYLARFDAIYLALAFLLLVGRQWRPLAPVVVGGLIVTVPWLLRNALAFGTPLPGQATELAFLRSNLEMFAYIERPSAAAFLAQGPELIVSNVAAAFRYNLFDVLVVPAAPVVVAGLAATIWIWRRPELRRTGLVALVLSGSITFVATSTIFPIATLWGTFQHAAGPLLAGLIVSATLGADALVARIRELRRWPRSNAWLGQVALLALTLPLTFLLVAPLPGIAADLEQRHGSVARAVLAQPDVPDRLITDHPVWLAEATGIPSVALPDEAIEALVQLARDLDAPMVVVIDGRGRYPAVLRTPEGRTCFDERQIDAPSAPDAALFVLRADCT